MKKILFILTLLSIWACTHEKKSEFNFTISGVIKNAPENTIVTLFHRDANDSQDIDSVIVKNSEFKLEGNSSSLDFYGIKINNNDYLIYLLIDSADNIKISADFNDLQAYNVENSLNSQLIQILENKLNETNKKIKTATDSNKSIIEIIAEHRKFSEEFVSKHDTSLASIIALSEKFINGENVLPIDSFYTSFKNVTKKLSVNYSQTSYYKQLTSFVKNYEAELQRKQPITELKVKPTEFQNFKASTLDGNIFSLESLKGKWILINFWATWASQSYLNNQTIFQVSNNDKINIVQISLDKNTKALNDTLAKYNFKHTLINDELGWSSELVNLYAVDMLPTFILINPKGKIELFTSDFNELIEKIKNIE